jgi:hypothetical protein
MSISYNPTITTDGLLIHLDAANTKSYLGTGTNWKDLSLTGNNGRLSTSSQFNSSDKTFLINSSTNVVYSSETLIGNASSFTIDCWLLVSNINNIPSGGGTGSTANMIAHVGAYGANGFRFGVQLLSTGTVYPVFATGQHVPNNSDGIEIQARNVAISTGTYFQTAVAYNASLGITSMYVNGISVASTNTGLYVYTSTMSLHIGGTRQGTYGLNGKIGLVKWYNRALTAGEIFQNFSAHRGRYGI